jgi:hypothetical protein
MEEKLLEHHRKWNTVETLEAGRMIEEARNIVREAREKELKEKLKEHERRN